MRRPDSDPSVEIKTPDVAMKSLYLGSIREGRFCFADGLHNRKMVVTSLREVHSWMQHHA